MKKTLAFLVAAVLAVTALCACLTVSAESTNLALNATVTGADPTNGNPWTDNYDASLVDGNAVDTVALADAPHDWFAFYYHADYVSNAVWDSEAGTAGQAVGTFTIDLGASASVDTVRIHMVTDEATTSGAVAPQRIKVEYSVDNAAWNTLVEQTDFSAYSGVAWVELKGSAAVDARYIRIAIGFRSYTLLLNEVEVLGTAAGADDGSDEPSEETSAAPAPTVIKNVAEGKPYTGAEPSTHPDVARYNAKLTDGVAKDSLSDLVEGDWFAFYHNEGAEGINAPDKVGTLVIDLEEVFSVSSVKINTFVGNMWGIVPPEAITVEYSEDGKTYTVLEEKTFTTPEREKDETGKEIDIDKVELVEFKGAEEVNARYIKVTVKLSGIFAFLNEIEVMGAVPADEGDTSETTTTDNATGSTSAPEASASSGPAAGDAGLLGLAVLAAVALAGAAVAVKVRR